MDIYLSACWRYNIPCLWIYIYLRVGDIIVPAYGYILTCVLEIKYSLLMDIYLSACWRYNIPCLWIYIYLRVGDIIFPAYGYILTCVLEI